MKYRNRANLTAEMFGKVEAETREAELQGCPEVS